MCIGIWMYVYTCVYEYRSVHMYIGVQMCIHICVWVYPIFPMHCPCADAHFWTKWCCNCRLTSLGLPCSLQSNQSPIGNQQNNHEHACTDAQKNEILGFAFLCPPLPGCFLFIFANPFQMAFLRTIDFSLLLLWVKQVTSLEIYMHMQGWTKHWGGDSLVGWFCDILPIPHHSLSNSSFNIVVTDRRDAHDGVITYMYMSYKIT